MCIRDRYGATHFWQPSETAGYPEKNRFLGIRDLVGKFDGIKTRNTQREVGWTLALLEMLVDPLLSTWVPEWLRE